jgi:hypothetical protein
MSEKIFLQNPSSRLLAALGLISEDCQYERTCHSDTCCCASHDSGYHYVEIDSLPQGLEIHRYSGNVHCHGNTVLHSEYVSSHTCRNLPVNAPDWAHAIIDEKYPWSGSNRCIGTDVDVTIDGDFTVVKRWDDGRLSNIFATTDGLNDHTSTWKKMNFDRLKQQTIAEYLEQGLTLEESERLFKVGKEQWTKEFIPRLIENRYTIRSVKDIVLLYDMARTLSGREQSQLAFRSFGSEVIKGLSCPRTQTFAGRALWVFWGIKTGDPRPESVYTPKVSGFQIPGHLFTK